MASDGTNGKSVIRVETDKEDKDVTKDGVEREDFQFLVEEVSKFTQLGINVSGKVQRGEIDTRTKPWLVIKRTGKRVQVQPQPFMHMTVADDDYWVRQGVTTAWVFLATSIPVRDISRGIVFDVKTSYSVSDFKEGDLLELATPPPPAPTPKFVAPSSFNLRRGHDYYCRCADCKRTVTK